MRTERNTIHTQKSSEPTVAYLAAGSEAPMADIDRRVSAAGVDHPSDSLHVIGREPTTPRVATSELVTRTYLPIGLALHRGEDRLPAGAEAALCFAALPAELPEWIELVPGGAIAGADGRSFVNDKPADFVALSAQLRRIPAGWCIDFDHQLQLATNDKVGGTAPAAGWITELQAHDDGSIWGKVEWTDLGAEAVQKKRYRGISPVFAFHKESKRALGLISAALTNNPNLDLVALNSREASTRTPQEKPDMDWLKTLLGLPDDASDEAIRTALNAFIAFNAAMAGVLGIEPKAAIALNGKQLEDALAKKFGGGKEGDVLVAVCSQAGVAAGASADAIVTAIRAKGVDLGKYVTMEAHNATRAELERFRQAELDALIETGLQSGKLLPAQKEWATALAAQDPKLLRDYLGVTAEHLAPVKKPSDGDTAANHGLTAAELAVCTQMGLDPKAYAEANKTA
jgi:phage I-like protein